MTMKVDRINKTIAVSVPGNACNFRCEYCYVSHSENNKKIEAPIYNYSVEHMIYAFRPERIGGICEIVLCGSAETLLSNEAIELAKGLMRYGHIVTIVSNASLSKQIDKLLDIEPIYRKNLIFKASFHYDELLNRGLIDTYFQNLHRIVDSGASVFPTVILSKRNIDRIEEISKLFYEEFDEAPYSTPCFDVDDDDDLRFRLKLAPEIDAETKKKICKFLPSKVFEETLRFTKIDPHNHFCYAGKWGYIVDMSNGNVDRCIENSTGMNFFENIDQVFEIENPVAYSCGIHSCFCHYNYFALGLMPDAKSIYTYGDLIYKEAFISEHIRNVLNVDFSKVYGEEELNQKFNHAKEAYKEQRELMLNSYMWMKDEFKKHGIDTSVLWGNPFIRKEVKQAVQNGKKIVVYGIGRKYEQWKTIIDFDISFFLKTTATEGEMLEGKHVYTPEYLRNVDKQDYFVVIAGKAHKEMSCKLESLGFKEKENFV